MLAGRYLDGVASRADVESLEEALATDDASRRLFIEWCELDSSLAALAARRPRPSVAAPPGRSRRRIGAIVMVLAASAVVVTFLRTQHGPVGASGDVSHYDERTLPVVTVATVRGDGGPDRDRAITPSTIRAGKGIALRAGSGADVQLTGDTVYGVSAIDEGALFVGSVFARLRGPASRYSVTASNLRVADRGTSFRVARLDDDLLSVTVLDGTAEVFSRVRLPLCYWSFDDLPSGPSVGRTSRDECSSIPAAPGPGAEVVEGIVGAGAVRFDNTPGAGLSVDGGLGEKVGEGLLSMRVGMTIEALFVSRWSAAEGDYDEIYRKEDGTCRVLLSFQNDGLSNAAFSDPPVVPGPCLSFGLHLGGVGYRELDMPLDGREGRPTVADLADGRPHHVVATYDSFSGAKAIAIDGVKRFEHVVPMGSLILCGGPERAEIGNHRGLEPFTGVIDEVAIYDYPLTPAEIEDHFLKFRRGEPYVAPASLGPEGRWRPIDRLASGESRTFNHRTAEASGR